MSEAARGLPAAEGSSFSVSLAKRTSGRSRGAQSAPSGVTFDDFDALLDGLRRGHPHAYQKVFDQFAGRVQGFAAARGVEDPAALTNDVLLVVFQGSDRFRGSESNFTSWVFRIARNKIIDDHRRQSRRPVHASDDAPLAVMAATDADPALLQIDPQETERILAHLSAPQREVVILRVLAGLTNAEVAKAIGKREGAVRALYHRAMVDLRERLAS